MADRLADLSSRGVSIWLDDLSRERLTSGSLASLVARDHVVGVTTNPGLEQRGLELFEPAGGNSATSWPPSCAIRVIHSSAIELEPTRQESGT
jgi:hypothetical protein